MKSMPLRCIIQNFLEYVASLEVQTEDGKDCYDTEFQELKVLTEEIRAQNSCSYGEKESNRRKNRYKDILPYDFNRVVLSEVPAVSDSDYINASYIKGASGSRAYIASQAPLPHTVEDFWRMIFEADVQVVVMASNEIEAGRPKCEKYWPDEGETKQIGNVTVTLEQQRDMCEDFKVKRLKAQMGESPPKILHHFHYHNWPDHGVPTSVTPILDMVELIRHEFQPSETLPVLVHCSAGCGRTGTVCAIDYVWGLLRSGKLTEDFSLKQLILDLRRQRIAMVQTKEQYVLVHRAVKELFERHLKVIDDHPYENLDFSGKPLGLKEEPDYANIIRDDDNLYENLRTFVGSATGLDKVPSDKSTTTSTSEVAVGSNQNLSSTSRPPSDGDVPPLPIKVKLKVTSAEDEVQSEEPSASKRPSSAEGSVGGQNVESPQTTSRSKMEYVNDWCSGISSPDDSLKKLRQGNEGGSPRVKRLSLSGGSTASSSTSLARSKHAEKLSKEKPIVSLVRKPSIAKLRELFSSGTVNSDSSSPPSPDGWSHSSPPRLRRPRAATDPLVEDHQTLETDVSTRSLVKLKRRMPKQSKNYVDLKEYEGVVSRYMDVSLRIFNENKQQRHTSMLLDGEKVELRDSNPQLKFQHVSPSLSASSEGIVGAATMSNVSSSRSSPSRDGAGRFSPTFLRHSPSPAQSSSPSPRDRSERMSEFVGRLVRPRRNSLSEKRNSTWYDEMPLETEAEVAADQSQDVPNARPNRKALFFGSKSPEEKATASRTSVKRSISMKVGFNSPFIRRKHTNVAAYLAVEDNQKQVNCDGGGTDQQQQQPVKLPLKLSRKLHGYVNVKPVQHTKYVAGGGPVELRNFSLHSEDVHIRTPPSDRRQQSPSSTRRHCIPLDSLDSDRLMHTTKKSPRVFKRRIRSPYPDQKPHLKEASQMETLQNATKSPMFTERLKLDDSSAGGRRDDDIKDLDDCAIDREAAEVARRVERELHEGSEQARRHSSSAFSRDDNLYGADMDEYCQKMLQDCHNYLLTHQYSNLTDEALRNIRCIEDTVHRSPRNAILDVTSSMENVSTSSKFSDVADGRETRGRPRLSSNQHNYERLWFSRSGKESPWNGKEKHPGGECSVDEASIVFASQDDDESGADDKKTEFDAGVCRLVGNEWVNTVRVPSPSVPAFVPSPSLSNRVPKNQKFIHSVDELETLINELELDARKVENSAKQRKPRPVPRTVMNVTAQDAGQSSSADSCGSSDRKSCGSDASIHLYECISDIDPMNYCTHRNVEHQRLLGSSAACPRSYQDEQLVDGMDDFNLKCNAGKNHEYEEIMFVDRHAARWPPTGPQDPLYAKVSHEGPTAHVANSAVGTCVYGQVNKPRRRKHSTGHSRRSPARSQTLVSQPREGRTLVSVPFECSQRPVAPPRVRRHLSSSSFACRYGPEVATARELPLGSCDLQGSFSPQSYILNTKVNAGYSTGEVIDKEENEAPPVPIKTKDAYVPLISKGTGINNSEDGGGHHDKVDNGGSKNSAVVAPLSSLGFSFGKKKLSKIQTSLFSKLGLRNDRDSDTSSNGSGGSSPKVNRKVNMSEFEYSQCLNRKPKGPRDPPVHWNVTTTS